MKTKNRNFLLIFSAFFGLLFLSASHAGAALVSLNGDNAIFSNTTLSSDFDLTGFSVNSWRTPANAELTQKEWHAPTVALQNSQMAAHTPPDDLPLSFIEKKLDGLGLRLAAMPGYAWLIGFGLIGLVSIRGGNCNWKHSMG
jgi:hypothetical protein